MSLTNTAYKVQEGNRLRLALSCADFPTLLQFGRKRSIRIAHHGSELNLPIVVPDLLDPLGSDAWDSIASQGLVDLQPPDEEWTIEQTLIGGGSTMRVTKARTLSLDSGHVASYNHAYTIGISRADDVQPTVSSRSSASIKGQSEDIEVHVETRCSEGERVVDATVYRNGSQLATRHWEWSSPTGAA